MKKKILTLVFAISSVFCFSQYASPTINGVIGTNEYGTHTNGQNQQGNWYITWDATNLFIALDGSNTSEGAIFYIDRNPLATVNGGTNSDGTLVGQAYDGTNFSRLPFRADFVTYFGNGYSEYRTANGSNGWSSNFTSFGSYVDNGSNVREISIPWSTMGGLPSSFNFFGYVTSNAGVAYNQVPSGNPSASFGTSATANYYLTVSNTANGTATKPFSRTSFSTASTITLSNAQSLWDLTVNGTSITTTLSAMQTVSGAVAVASGNTLAAGGNLTLVSTATGTARIATISNTFGNVTGNVTCQLYIPGGNRRFRFLSHPFNANLSIAAVLGTSISYTGTGGTTNGFSHNTTTNNPSVFTWISSIANGSINPDPGWIALTNANSSTGWSRRRGLRILIRGTFNEGLNGLPYTPSPVTINMTNTLATSVGSVNLLPNSGSNGGSGSTQNFILLGNPFAAPFNIGQAITSDASNFNSADNIRRLTNTIYLRNPYTGSYIAVDVSLSPNYTIPAYTGFFGVITQGNTQIANDFAFNISNIATTTSTGTSVFGTVNEPQKFIELKTIYNGEEYDNTIVKFDKKYKTDFNNGIDGTKPSNDVVNNYTLSADKIKLAVNTTPFINGTFIPMGIGINAAGNSNITFKVAQLNLDSNQQIVLWDKLTNLKTILAQDAAYNFTINNTDSATFGDSRFVLLLNNKTIVPTPAINSFIATIAGSNIVSNKLQVFISLPANKTATATLTNIAGQTIATQQITATGNISYNLSSLPSTNYFVTVQCGKEKTTLKAIKQ